MKSRLLTTIILHITRVGLLTPVLIDKSSSSRKPDPYHALADKRKRVAGYSKIIETKSINHFTCSRLVQRLFDCIVCNLLHIKLECPLEHLLDFLRSFSLITPHVCIIIITTASQAHPQLLIISTQ